MLEPTDPPVSSSGWQRTYNNARCSQLWLTKVTQPHLVFDGKWFWVQAFLTERASEDLGCCSRAHVIPGAVTVPVLVRNIVCKMSQVMLFSAVIELIFFTGAGMRPCFGFVLEAALITQGRFRYC